MAATRCATCDEVRRAGDDRLDYVVAPCAGGGWHEWGAALVRMLCRIDTDPTRALVIEQPTITRRYVQLLIGHGRVHAEASSNVYLVGDERLGREHEVLLQRIGWRRPVRTADDPVELPANWTRPVVTGGWDDLVDVVLATLVGVFGFVEDAPVELRTFLIERPCRDCRPAVLR